MRDESRCCAVCGIEKDASEFDSRKTGKDGLSTQCKVCRRAYFREYAKQYRRTDKYKQYKKKYRKRPEVRSKEREYARNRYNSETTRAYRKQCVESGRAAAWTRKYRQTIKGKESIRRWRRSSAGKASAARSNARYRAGIGVGSGCPQPPEVIERMRASQTPEKRAIAREHCIRLNSGGFWRETGIERRVKSILLSWNLSFRQNYPFSNIGVVDFHLKEHKLAIECDGEYWHNKPRAKERDPKKDSALSNMGIAVLRLPEKEINTQPETICQKIYAAIMATRDTNCENLPSLSLN